MISMFPLGIVMSLTGTDIPVGIVMMKKSMIHGQRLFKRQ